MNASFGVLNKPKHLWKRPYAQMAFTSAIISKKKTAWSYLAVASHAVFLVEQLMLTE